MLTRSEQKPRQKGSKTSHLDSGDLHTLYSARSLKPNRFNVSKAISEAEREGGIVFAPEQRLAFECLPDAQVLVIIGGPGPCELLLHAQWCLVVSMMVPCVACDGAL